MNSLVPSALAASENSLLLPSTSKFSRGHAGSNAKKINNNAIISISRFENSKLLSASKPLNGGKEKEGTAKVTRIITLDHMAISPGGFYKLWLVNSLLKYTCLIQHYEKWTKCIYIDIVLNYELTIRV